MDPRVPAADRGEIRLLLGQVHFQLEEFESGRHAFELAAEELADRPAKAARAMLSLASVAWNPLQPAPRRRELLERASGLIERVESAPERFALTIQRAHVAISIGDEAGWRLAAEIPTSAATPTERHEIARGMVNIALRALTWGRYDEARRCIALAGELGRGDHLERIMQFVRYCELYLDWRTGAWEGLAERCKYLADSDDAPALLRESAFGLLGSLELATGHRGKAEGHLRQVIDAHVRRWPGATHSRAAAGLGRLYLADGAVDEARRVTAPIVEMFLHGRPLWEIDDAAVHLEALVGSGFVERAEELFRQFSSWLGDLDAPVPRAGLATCRAVVARGSGDHTLAAASFAEAAEAWARMAHRYDELLACERRARCLLEAGDRDEAVAELSRTQERLGELGARWDADRIAHQLRQLGVDVARPWRGGRRGYGDQLSPRELDVVRLVARGLTNQQAADALFLSARTVERHLSSAMHKFGVSSRTALAVAAVDAGLVTREATEASA